MAGHVRGRDAWAPQREALRRALRDAGITQAQFARDLGITAKHLSQMLTGAIDGRTELWARMADALGMVWVLKPVDPNDSLITWTREYLGLEVEPWQAARIRQFVRED